MNDRLLRRCYVKLNFKTAMVSAVIASFSLVGVASADLPTGASRLSLNSPVGAQLPVGTRVGAKRKGNSNGIAAGLPLIAVIAGAAAATAAVVAVAADGNSDSP
jgi:hypothetical protein